MTRFGERLVNFLARKFMGFVLLLVFGYFRPELFGSAITAYALLVGGDLGAKYLGNNKAKNG